MKSKKDSSLMFFLFPKILCICAYLIIVAVFGISKLNSIHFWYCLPSMIFIYFPLYYLMFYYPKDRKCTNLAFNLCNGIFLFVTMGTFFGVYFGVFYSSLQYDLQEVDDCQVIGKYSTDINSAVNYSILYVDFQKEGQNMLGYGCLSSNYDILAGTPYIQPYQIYEKNDDFLCLDLKGGLSYYNSQRQLQSQRKRITATTQNTRSGVYTCYYKFSEIKLPDWMCQSFSISHEDLTKKQKCYVHYFKNNLNTNAAFQNSKDRVYLKEAKEFAIVTFKPLSVPLDQYICFIIFLFCPFITSLSVFFNIFTKRIVKHLRKMLQLSKYLHKIDTSQLKEKSFTAELTPLKEERFQLTPQLKNQRDIGEGSPPLTQINTSVRMFLQADAIVENQIAQGNNNNLRQSVNSGSSHNNQQGKNNFDLNEVIANPKQLDQHGSAIDQIQINIKHKKSRDQNQQQFEQNSSQTQSEKSNFQLIDQSDTQEKQQNEEKENQSINRTLNN